MLENTENCPILLYMRLAVKWIRERSQKLVAGMGRCGVQGKESLQKGAQGFERDSAFCTSQQFQWPLAFSRARKNTNRKTLHPIDSADFENSFKSF
jgi:hypothetical protein